MVADQFAAVTEQLEGENSTTAAGIHNVAAAIRARAHGGEEYWKTKQGAAFNAISELCNPDASLSERMEAATSLRAAFGWPVKHADGCAIHEVDEPDGSECDCEYWDDSPPSAAIRSLAHGDSNDR